MRLAGRDGSVWVAGSVRTRSAPLAAGTLLLATSGAAAEREVMLRAAAQSQRPVARDDACSQQRTAASLPLPGGDAAVNTGLGVRARGEEGG